MKNLLSICLGSWLVVQSLYSQTNHQAFSPGEIWKDDQGIHINAHGGGLLYHKGAYYWYGEFKNDKDNNARAGVSVYTSKNLSQWTFEGISLPVSEDPNSPIALGCIIERPKVIYNKKSKKFIMWFHLELKDKGYSAAQTGLAVADRPEGPFQFIKSLRPNAKTLPINFPDSLKDFTRPERQQEAKQLSIEDGRYLLRDYSDGQMARDMTLFVDQDGKAYHIFASEENQTLHIAELTDDYQSHNGRYARIAPGGHNEAPAIMYHKGYYYLFASGCTGWTPNQARLYRSKALLSDWEYLGDPCLPSHEEDAKLTYHSQSTFIIPVQGKKDCFIFMADRWKPECPIDGRYVWLPIQFQDDKPYIE